MTEYFNAEDVESKLVELRDHIERTRWNTNAHEFAHATAKLEALEEVFEILRSRVVDVKDETQPLYYGVPSLSGEEDLRMVIGDHKAGNKLIDIVRGAVARNEQVVFTPREDINGRWCESDNTQPKRIDWTFIQKRYR